MIKKLIFWFLVILGTPIVLLAGGFFVLWLLISPRGLLVLDRSIDREYRRLELGTSIEEVVDRLGPARSKGENLLLPQEMGFEDAFQRAQNSEAIIFYLWMNGGNWFYCLGFDDEGKLVIKEQGHS